MMQEKHKYVALNFEHVSLIYKIDNNFNFFGPFSNGKHWKYFRLKARGIQITLSEAWQYFQLLKSH